MRLIVLLLALLTSSPAYSQQTADEITDRQITIYQTRLEKKCMETGNANMEALHSALAFCGCMMTTLKEGMTHAQWQQLTLLALNYQDQQEVAFIGRQMRKSHACRHNTSTE